MSRHHLEQVRCMECGDEFWSHPYKLYSDYVCALCMHDLQSKIDRMKLKDGTKEQLKWVLDDLETEIPEPEIVEEEYEI